MYFYEYRHIYYVIIPVMNGSGGRRCLGYVRVHQRDVSVYSLWEGGEMGVLPVFVLYHCYDGEEVMYTMYLDDERGQVVLSHQSSYIYWYCTVTQ